METLGDIGPLGAKSGPFAQDEVTFNAAQCALEALPDLSTLTKRDFGLTIKRKHAVAVVTVQYNIPQDPYSKYLRPSNPQPSKTPNPKPALYSLKHYKPPSPGSKVSASWHDPTRPAGAATLRAKA